MTDYTILNAAQLTEFLENSPLYTANETTLWGSGSPPLAPFYYEASTNTVNFAYGINLVAAASDPQLQNEVNNILATLPQGVTISADQWATIADGGKNGSSTAAELQSII